MKKYSFLLFLQLFVYSLQAQDSISVHAPASENDSIKIQHETSVSTEGSEQGIWQMANEAYIKGDFRKAIDLYNSLLESGKESDVLYYNLGNAYYKANETTLAILNYERALLLNPGDGDTRFNLEMAKLKTIDKIEPVGRFFLSEWITSLRNVFSTNQWATIGIVSFLLLIGCLVLFFFSRQISWKKVGFYASIVLLVLTVSSNVFSYQQKKSLTDRNVAIISVPTVTLKGSPDNSGTDIVILHEGLKVTIKSKLGDWNEVILEDGTVGWVESKKIATI